MERVQIRGLPEGDYQVQCKTTDGWQKLFQTILPEILSTGSKGYYYIFAQNGSCNFGRSKYDDVEEVSYEDWKEAIETHIERVGDYKVGDIVYITKGYFDLSAGEIRSLEGFDGRHWWVKTKNHPKLYLDIGEYFRHATKEEIAANEKKKETQKLLSIKTGDGLDVYEGENMLWVQKKNGTWDYICDCTISLLHLEPGNTLSTGNWTVFHTKEAADTWMEEVNKSVTPVRKDGWKVGDKLPVEFLNLCTYYTDIHDIHSATNVEDDDGEKWVHDRVVKTVTSKGWAEVSGTYQGTYLSPKHEYPEYEHYEKPKAESPIIVTRANAAIGMQVVRGRDWDYDKQDHFEGKPSVGTIVQSRHYFPYNPKSGWVSVKWKNGSEDNYRIGENEYEDDEDTVEKFDLYVYQGSTEPVQQPVTPTPSKREEKKEVKKSMFVQCIDMSGSTASFVVGRVYEVTKQDDVYYYFNHCAGGMFKERFKEVKGDNPIQIPVGWKPGDSWRHRDNTCGLSISVHPKDDNFNSYFIDYGENGTAWVGVNQINDCVKSGIWIINPSQKGRQEEKQEQKEEKQSQTIISKQTNTKTKQNENIKESSIGISITEQCFITSGSYKFNKAAYIPGDEERITKGQRRQGSAVRG